MKKKESKNLAVNNSELHRRINDRETIAVETKQPKAKFKKSQEEVNIRNTILEAINAVTNKIYLSLDYNTIAKEAIAAMIHYGKTSAVSIYEFREDSNCLVLLDSSESFVNSKSRRLTQLLHIGKCAGGEAIIEKKIIFSDDTLSDKRILPEVREALRKEGRKNRIKFLKFPLDNRTIVLLCLIASGWNYPPCQARKTCHCQQPFTCPATRKIRIITIV